MSKEHERILKSMLGDVDPPLGEDETKRIASALKAFSVKQLQKMDNAGVRIWPFVKGLPPEYKITSVADLGSPAAYHYQFRTIRVSPTSLGRGAATDFLRHELAHAWDDVRTDRKPTNLRKMKENARLDEFNRLAKEKAPFESESGKKLPPGKKLTMQDMLSAYKSNLAALGDKTKSFAHPSTADSHNAKDVKEFYAEGYSVFHGHSQESQSRMLWLARDLFDYLEEEAKVYGLSPPPRKDLEKYLDDTEKGWRAWSGETKK